MCLPWTLHRRKEVITITTPMMAIDLKHCNVLVTITTTLHLRHQCYPFSILIDIPVQVDHHNDS
jgi:hypothetical protein